LEFLKGSVFAELVENEGKETDRIFCEVGKGICGEARVLD